MKRLFLMFVLLFAGIAIAQVQPQIQGAGPPTNPCYNGGQQYVDQTNHVLYGCPSSGSNWANLGLGNLTNAGGNIRSLAADPATCSTSDTNGTNNIYYNTVSATFKFCSAANTWSAFAGGSTAWSSITSGTNTTAAMVVGTGASLATSGSGAITATGVPYSGVTAGANTAAKTEGTGGSLVPSGQTAILASGQIAASTPFIDVAPAAIWPVQPTTSVASTGGTLANSNFFSIIAYHGATAANVPGPELRTVLNAGNCGTSTCSVTINMPTTCQAGNLPAGATGCDVYTSNAPQIEKLQTASANCSNITTATCVVGTLGAGASITFGTTTGITPPNLQAGAPPDGIIPSLFMRAGDGNFYKLAGVDISGLNILPEPRGTFTFTHRLFVNDTNGPPVISNALVSIHHQEGNFTGDCTTCDDRALGLEMIDSAAGQANEQSLTQYNERIVSNNNDSCPMNTGAVGSGEVCAGSIRAITADQRSAPVNTMGNSVGIVGSFQISSAATGLYASCGPTAPCVAGVAGQVQENVVTGHNLQGGWVAAVAGKADGANPNTNGTGVAFYAIAPTVRYNTSNVGLYVPAGYSNAADWGVLDAATSPNKFQGAMQLGGNATAIQTNSGVIGITGAMSDQGSLGFTQLATPTLGSGNVGTVGTTGTSVYTYCITAVDGNGKETPCSPTQTINTGFTPLSVSNFNRVFNYVITRGVTSYNIYRTAVSGGGSPSTTGLIGSVTVQSLCADISNAGTCGNQVLFNDQGAAGNGATAPVANQTGSIQPFTYLTNTNCAVNSVSPAACGSAAAGAVVIPTTTTTYTVNTTAVSAASRIMFNWLSFASNLPSSPTCVAPATTSVPTISAVSAGVSFTVALPSTTGTTCLQYWVVN